MKKVLKTVLLIVWILINIILFVGTIGMQYDKVTGRCVQVKAKVTYVREYYNHDTYKGVSINKYLRKNGYISWKYDGKVHNYEDERDSFFDFSTDIEEGDTVKIWVDADNGKFVEADNNNGKYVGCFIFFVIDVIMVVRFLARRKRNS